MKEYAKDMQNEFINKRILVLGLGFSGGGVGVTKFLLREGAYVIVTDLKTKKELASSLKVLGKHKNLSFALGGYPKDLSKFDVVVLNPAIDFRSDIVKKIKKAGVPVESEIGLFLKNCKGKVVAITGTKGKGTTASLVYEILKRGGKKVMIGGNIGGSLLGSLAKITRDMFVVLEISSFQLDLLALSKQKVNLYISALTNIYPDHLDRYNSFAGYKKSKLSIFMHKSHFNVDGRNISGVLPPWVRGEKIKLIGEHNKKNITMAIRIAQIAGIKKERIAKAIYSFRGLPHRLEYVGAKHGVAFYNDSYSTTPDSTIAALKSFDLPKVNHSERLAPSEVEGLVPSRIKGNRRIILILGGVSKGMSFNQLAREANRRVKQVIVFGKSISEIRKSFKNVKSSTLDIFGVVAVRTLKEAVRKAKKIAANGDIILFSPACASFDQFRNAKERGEKFKALMKK